MTGSLRRGSYFPISEIYGFPHDSVTQAAKDAFRTSHCPFMGAPCEKKRQYGYGYCSVVYSAEWDLGDPAHYAVCDHRLDGDPVRWVIRDHFGSLMANVVAEVTVTSSPRLNIDFFGYVEDPTAPGGLDMIAIETQAIDLRGGGVGPAWQAWLDGSPDKWREYYTQEANRKGRRDSVDYGVNVGNVYKRLGTQVAVKGEYLREVGVPLYVVTQHRILSQLRKRVIFDPVEESDGWDICFVGFDYTGALLPNGQMELGFVESVRTSLGAYQRALTAGTSVGAHERADLISKIRRKATTARRLAVLQDTLY